MYHEFLAASAHNVIDLANTSLSARQRNEQRDLLAKYDDRFATSLCQIDRCNMHECTLPTKGRPSSLAIFFLYPPRKADEIDRQVEDYLKHDLIEECDRKTHFLAIVC